MASPPTSKNSKGDRQHIKHRRNSSTSNDGLLTKLFTQKTPTRSLHSDTSSSRHRRKQHEHLDINVLCGHKSCPFSMYHDRATVLEKEDPIRTSPPEEIPESPSDNKPIRRRNSVPQVDDTPPSFLTPVDAPTSIRELQRNQNDNLTLKVGDKIQRIAPEDRVIEIIPTPHAETLALVKRTHQYVTENLRLSLTLSDFIKTTIEQSKQNLSISQVTVIADTPPSYPELNTQYQVLNHIEPSPPYTPPATRRPVTELPDAPSESESEPDESPSPTPAPRISLEQAPILISPIQKIPSPAPLQRHTEEHELPPEPVPAELPAIPESSNTTSLAKKPQRRKIMRA